MTQTAALIKLIGESRIRAAFAVHPSRISQIKTKGEFPANWFHEMEILCNAAGVECPRDLFAFKRLSKQKQKNGGANAGL